VPITPISYISVFARLSVIYLGACEITILSPTTRRGLG
jgi:hypothetical protein